MKRGAPARMKVLDVELGEPLPALRGLDGYGAVLAIVRWHGVPVGCVDVRVTDGVCSPAAQREAILRALTDDLLAFSHEVGSPVTESALRTTPFHELHLQAPSWYEGPWPSLTVAVCTRDRADDLAQSLDALVRLDYPDLDLVVVDNAPSTGATERLVRGRYPSIRYVTEPRPGLNWARARAVREARGEVIAFTDDDAVVESGWARALASAFALGGDGVMAAGGVTVPSELETDAQVYFERYGGFAPGFRRKVLRGAPNWGARGVWHYVPMAQHFSGANMAFRRRVFDEVGTFDPALDVGTPTNGGGDQEMFFRVLNAGYAAVYEPRALARHRHRREYAQLRRQISGWGTGSYALLTRIVVTSPEASWVVGLVAARGLWHQLHRIATSLVRPPGFPRSLMFTELRGALLGPLCYWRARRQAEATARAFDTELANVRA